jgi:acyl carrier protein
VIETATTRFGAIHGVIHAAGAMDGAGIAAVHALTREACEAQFKPKVRGAEVLDEILDGASLDFCLATSSLSAVLGGLSFGAYAAANSFLDGLAERIPPRGRPAWTSVNFDGWKFVAQGNNAAKNALADLEMTPSEGVDSLTRVLSAGIRGRAVVSTGELDVRLDRYVRRAPSADADADRGVAAQARYARPELETAYAAPIDEMQERIAEVWQEFLGIERIGRNDNFFDLGGHSLLALRITTRLREEYGIDLALRDFFEAQTVEQLAELVRQAMSVGDQEEIEIT